LKKGIAMDKENCNGQTESREPMKLQQQLLSRALSDVAVAAGVAPGAEGGDLRVLCLQVVAN
jgi:hypothetical protein